MAIAWQSQGFAQEAQDETETIVVRGVKGSVISAQNFKMESKDITDSIVAEDIGKLPDNTVASALQRVTGVQITRENGEANTVLVRGLPNVVTTMNGRNIFTTTGRGMALADIPADLLYKVDVKKSSSASDVEGGIAGLIDVQLRKPFDFKDGLTVAGGLRAEYSDKAEAWNPIGSVTVNNTWETDAGKFGAMASLSRQTRDFMDQVNFITAPSVLPEGVVNNPLSVSPNIEGQDSLAPGIAGGYFRYGDRSRDSGNFAFQWAPDNNSSYYAEAFFVNYEQDSQLNFWVPLPNWGGWGEIKDANDNVIGNNAYVSEYKEGTNVAQSMVRPDAPGTITSNQPFANSSDTYQFAVGGKWVLDDMTIKSDLAFTKSKAKERAFILDLTFFADEVRYDFSKDGEGVSDVDIRNTTGSAYDMTNLDQYELNTYFDNRSAQEGEEIAWSLDASYFVNLGFINQIDFGTRLSERTAFNQEAESGGQANISGARVPLTDFPGLEDYTPTDYMKGVVSLNNTQWLTPNADYLLKNRADIREAMGHSRAEPEFIPGRFYDNSENNYALYAKANLETEIAGMFLDGHFGVRVVRLESEFNGNLTTQVADEDPIITPVNQSSGKTEILPSMSLRLALTDDLYLRTAYGKTVTRPGFADLNPAVVYDVFSETSVNRTGSGGNPFLESIESTNYDLSLEWYFADAASLTAATFYREIEGYIQSYATDEQYQNLTYSVTRPQNTGGGTLEGIEIGYTQFFDQLPGALSGLGVQLNGTFIDGETEAPTGEMQPITNVSDESYNAVLLYEMDKFSARLAYNWRSGWASTYDEGGAQPGSSVVNNPTDSLDFAINYDVNENLTVSFEGTNLTDSTYTNFFGGDSPADEHLYPRDTILRDRTFSVGVRFRM